MLIYLTPLNLCLLPLMMGLSCPYQSFSGIETKSLYINLFQKISGAKEISIKL
jgi:hypothetical protein